MQAQLSKLHVRFIQTQKSFSLLKDDNSQGDVLAHEQLYIKNNSSFYFINKGDLIQDEKAITLLFKEPNDYLNTLRCEVSAVTIEKGSDMYDDALLFFHVDEADVKQLLLLSTERISDT
ncbi:MAG: hypothetical protein PF439_06335 [Helicobacteraceae bacterium]|jgi:hypothetical protein|nr:hypothetical protein [Helicobacteraceae bacterium]